MQGTYQFDWYTGICDGEGQIFIPLWIDILLYYTSLQFLHHIQNPDFVDEYETSTKL